MERSNGFTLVIGRRHVTAIVAGLAMAAILLPVGVEAATGSSVNITDPISGGNKARVTSGRTLATGICDPFSTIGGTTCARVSGGKVRVGDGSGALTVDGFVDAATDIIPAAPVSCSSTLPDTGSGINILSSSTVGCAPVTLGVADTVALTGITVTNDGSGGALLARLRAINAAGCTGTVLWEGPFVGVAAGATEHLAFPQPLVAPNGTPAGTWTVCGFLSGATAGDQARVYVTGFIG